MIGTETSSENRLWSDIMEELDMENEQEGIHIFPYLSGSEDGEEDPELPTFCSENEKLEKVPEPDELLLDVLDEFPSPDEYVRMFYSGLAGSEEEASDLVGAGEIQLVSKPREVSKLKKTSPKKRKNKNKKSRNPAKNNQPEKGFVIEEFVIPEVETTVISEPEEISELVEASNGQKPKKRKNKKKKKSGLPLNNNKDEVTEENTHQQEDTTEDFNIQHEVEEITGVAEPRQVFELVEANEAELVSKPGEVTEMVEANEADLVSKPGEVTEMVEANEADLVSKPEEIAEKKSKKRRKRKKNKSGLLANKDQTGELLQPQEIIPPEDLIIENKVEATMGVSKPEEVTEIVEANEAELVSKPKQIIEMVETNEAELVSKPEEISKLIKACETNLLEEQQGFPELKSTEPSDNQCEENNKFLQTLEVLPEVDLFIPEKLAEIIGGSEPGDSSEVFRRNMPSMKLFNMLEIIADEPEISPEFHQLLDFIPKEDLKVCASSIDFKRQDKISLWRRFKKFMTPACLRQHKHERGNEEEYTYTPDKLTAIKESESLPELEGVEIISEDVLIPDEEVTEMLEPEEVSELTEASETQLDSIQEEVFEHKQRPEKISLWRRFKKCMTPSCRRQYKDKKNQDQM